MIQETGKKEIKELCRDYFELSFSALTGDRVALAKLGKYIIQSPLMIRNIMYYQNFEKFLDGMKYNPDVQRKFLDYLNEGDKEYKSKKILLTLDVIDSDFKANCIINLTKSVSYHFISSRYYVKLCQLITNMITEDLIHLKEVIKEGPVIEELVDEYERNGLMYLDSLRRYVFSEMAFDLDKYALSYTEKNYNYSETEKKTYPDKFQANMTFVQEEESDNILIGDTWIGN